MLAAGLASERDAEGHLASELARIRQEEASLPGQIAAIQAKLQQEVEEFQRASQRVEGEQRAMERKLGSLRECVSIYEQCLGLTFLQGENVSGRRVHVWGLSSPRGKHRATSAYTLPWQEELQMLMNQIDPRNPERVFMFSVRVAEDNTYQCECCHPILQAAVARSLTLAPP